MSATRADDRAAPEAPLQVLVLDEEREAAREREALLRAAGYDVAIETDGDAALAHVRAARVHLVVSEIYVPCSEGKCAVTALKQERHRLPRLRVLVHTRHTRPDDVEWALSAGADAIVPTHEPPHVLLAEVARLAAAVQRGQ